MAPDARMMSQMTSKAGFVAALDQSGGSTPAALRLYGIADSDYSGDEEMFRLVHSMRVRIMTTPSFSGEKVIGAILFEKTMDGDVGGKAVPSYLWEDRAIVPFLKVDKGLAAEANGVQLMKPIPDLDALLERAVSRGIFGTKMRSVIAYADRSGIASVVRQQFEIGKRILDHQLIPIIEPEVLVKSPTKQGAEAILLDEIIRELDGLASGQQVMIKVSIPTVPDFYKPLIDHKSVVRVVALSGGYSRIEACEKLTHNQGMIASFSRALTEDLKATMTDAEFDSSLGRAIGQIYSASVEKSPIGS
ncbi:fructose bisphosphate aldolase [Rhizobium mesosinicum]|uniref:fructose-bisphosphate aldolase n=1 Tax=Rhizobium mesosinicum TaxID=335017 RepID=A0ABS7GP50_9HYPH|nr:fructose bisphosphate aldolase [Rhizobium mesosinicum]MBW9051009.1 fructose bisphosphate aldolase [Rhizobium mesosinicum]